MRKFLTLLVLAMVAHVGWTLWKLPAESRTFDAAMSAAIAPFEWAYGMGESMLSQIAHTEEVVITLSAAGDVTHGGDRRKGTDLFRDELARQEGDYAFPFRNVRSIFVADDLTIVNYECALTKTKSATDNTYSFAGSPENAKALVLGSVEAVALDNNHVFDHGTRGYEDTQQALADAGIRYSGNGLGSVYETQGVRIGMLSYCTLRSGYGGIQKRLAGDIRALRDQHSELVIVSYHWGEEREYVPHERQIELGRATIDAGADLVLGHHSHVINPVERYNGKYIVYSLANFSFAGNSNPSDKDTFIFQQRFRIGLGGARDAGMRIVPCSISSTEGRNDFAPTPTGAEEAARIVRKLTELGAELKYGLKEYPLSW